MGRPKLSDLSCTLCNIKFKKKSLLNEHMANHLSSRPSRKHLKNYCYVCRKSFEPDKYKIHIQAEHQFDFHKMNIKKENDSSEEKLSAVENADIKSEPTDSVNEESDLESYQKTKSQKSKKKNTLKVKLLNTKCSICGMVCKGRKGLKIHMSAHKRSQCKSNDDDAVLNKNNEVSKEAVNHSQFQNKSNNFNNIANNPNSVLNFGTINSNFMNSANQPNAQFLHSVPNRMNQPNAQFLQSTPIHMNQPNAQFFQTIPIHMNQPNAQLLQSLLNHMNQPNAQLLRSIPNHMNQFSDILKFDCNSEEYTEWLKKFVYKCKTHNYPLSPELCRKVSHVADEILGALGNPQSFLKRKANHFYFMRQYNILSEIMLGHLEYQSKGINK